MGVGVLDGVTVRVGVEVLVGVIDGVNVGVDVDVEVGVGVFVEVLVEVEVVVFGWNGVKEAVGVRLEVGVNVIVGVNEMVLVTRSGVPLTTGLGEPPVCVIVGVGVAVSGFGARLQTMNPIQ